MGKTFAPLETWSKYILTSDVAFEKHYGAKATKNANYITEHLEQICICISENV